MTYFRPKHSHPLVPTLRVGTGLPPLRGAETWARRGRLSMAEVLAPRSGEGRRSHAERGNESIGLRFVFALCTLGLRGEPLLADRPEAKFLLPTGGRRGTTLTFHAGA